MIDFKNKVILGPMVRITTHPMRILCLNYGADLVYTEEIIDMKLIGTTRVMNLKLGSVDFVGQDGTIVFRTSEEEKGKVVLQLGTACPVKALLAAKKVENDVAAIDVNMGCPKDYSIKGGMGAALLKKPESISKILKNLVGNLSIPVTAKIRVLKNLDETMELVKLIVSCGVAALAVHGRTPADRPSEPCLLEVIKTIADSVSIPVIANGGSKEHIRLHDDIEYFKMQTNASSVMISRAAMWNPAIFSLDSVGKKQIDIAREYLALCLRYDHHEAGVKYCLLRMLMDYTLDKFYTRLTEAPDIRTICNEMDMLDALEEELARRSSARKRNPSEIDSEAGGKVIKLDLEEIFKKAHPQPDTKCFMEDIEVDKKSPRSELPKEKMMNLARKNNVPFAVYSSHEDKAGRLFYACCVYRNAIYVNLTGSKQKRWAEQGAAAICLKHNDMSL